MILKANTDNLFEDRLIEIERQIKVAIRKKDWHRLKLLRFDKKNTEEIISRGGKKV